GRISHQAAAIETFFGRRAPIAIAHAELVEGFVGERIGDGLLAFAAELARDERADRVARGGGPGQVLRFERGRVAARAAARAAGQQHARGERRQGGAPVEGSEAWSVRLRAREVPVHARPDGPAGPPWVGGMARCWQTAATTGRWR